MRVFLSALESKPSNALDKCLKENIKIPYVLVSYYYIQKDKHNLENFLKCLKVSKFVLVDSGAHTFQQGKTVDWENYTKQYAEFIKKYDCPKILGYFEMYADVIIGYERVKKLRRILEKATDKIIPVWHKGRGLEEYKKMCHETKGPIVSVTGFSGTEIRDDQYGIFLKYAWKCGKKVHCLGMTRKKVLDKVPFDFVDSSSWRMQANFGGLKRWSPGKKKLVDAKDTKGKFSTQQLLFQNLIAYIKMSKYYNIKWQKINHDLDF